MFRVKGLGIYGLGLGLSLSCLPGTNKAVASVGHVRSKVWGASRIRLLSDVVGSPTWPYLAIAEKLSDPSILNDAVHLLRFGLPN